VWLSESSNAQCSGEPGISDRFVSGFWWMSQLGRLALHGQQVAVRHNLSGADYALINEETVDPNPDYWASVLWKRLMGSKVLTADSGEETLPAFAHCTANPETPGSVTLVIMNLDQEEAVNIDVAGIGEGPKDLYLLTADEPLSKKVMLNGTVLKDDRGELPAMEPEQLDADQQFELPPTSYAFVVFPEAEAAACDNE
jgi:hypothetical protein